MGSASWETRNSFFLFSVNPGKGVGHVMREQARSVMGPRDRVGGIVCHHFPL